MKRRVSPRRAKMLFQKIYTLLEMNKAEREKKQQNNP